MGSGTSKPPNNVPPPPEEDVEDDVNNEPPVPIGERKKSERLMTPPRKVGPRQLIHDFSVQHEVSTVPKTNISRQSDIFEAASKGDVEGLAALLASNPALMWATTTADMNYYIAERNNVMETFHQVTLLHVAAEKGKEDVVKLLLSKNLPVDALCERKGRDIKITALHLACYNGKTPVAKILVEAGANINQSETDPQDKNDAILMQRPLHLAVRNKQVSVVKMLVGKGVDVEQKCKVCEEGLYVQRSVLELTDDPKITSILKRAVENNFIDPENCVAFGPGLNPDQKTGTVTEFTILARDKFKNFKRRGGDNVKVKFEEPDGTPVSWPHLVTDCKNGSYTITYTPNKEGKFGINILVTNYFTSDKKIIAFGHVASSPYRVTVEEPAVKVVSKVVPFRLHVNRVITHTTFPRDITFDELHRKTKTLLDIKSARPIVNFTHKNGNYILKITNDQQLSEALANFEKSTAQKFEMYLELVP